MSRRAIELAQMVADEGILAAISDDVRRMAGVVVIEFAAANCPGGLSLVLHASTVRHMVCDALIRLRAELAP